MSQPPEDGYVSPSYSTSYIPAGQPVPRPPTGTPAPPGLEVPYQPVPDSSYVPAAAAPRPARSSRFIVTVTIVVAVAIVGLVGLAVTAGVLTRASAAHPTQGTG